MNATMEKHMRQFEAGRYLHCVRRDSGKSLSAAAKDLGISAPYLSEIEKGTKVPSDTLIRGLCAYYELNENILFDMYGKVPLFTLEELDSYPEIKMMIAEIGANRKIPEERKQDLYDSITALYKEFLKSIESE